MNSSTLNVFQRLARQWDAIHPYNAAQLLKIEGTPGLSVLQDAWHDAMNDLGLGRVHVNGKSFRYECLNGEMVHYGVRVVPPGVSLDDYISEQLNKPFDNPAEPPFRPFMLAEQGAYYAGVIYHHWVADSVSIRALLQEWFVRLVDPQKARKTPLKLADAGYRRFLNPVACPGDAATGLLTAARWASSLRHAKRLDIGNGLDLSVRFAFRHLQDGLIEQLHAASRRRGVTLNDLFLSAIALTCDQYVPLKLRPRRNALALGSIVDLRPYSDPGMAEAFGLFLGFTNILCRPADLRDPQRLLRTISTQTARQKQLGIPQASALRLLAGTAAARFVSPERMALFYQKNVPIAGGISNVNLNRCWATQYHPRPLLDYIRVSPTGPIMPLVFATTTLGRQFHFALTYRPSVLPPERIDALSNHFHDSLLLYL